MSTARSTSEPTAAMSTPHFYQGQIYIWPGTDDGDGSNKTAMTAVTTMMMTTTMTMTMTNDNNDNTDDNDNHNTDDNDNDDDDDNNGVDLGLQGSERLRCRPGSSAIDMAIITCMPSHPGHKVED